MTGPNSAKLYDVFQTSKARILSLVLDPNTRPQNVGIKAAAWKYIQRVLLVGVRAGGDPRLQARSNDVSVALIQPGSLLNPAKVEEEANLLRTQLVTQLYGLDDPAILAPIINTFPPLVKQRPALAPLIVQSMAAWTPSAMEAARRPPMQIRSVEKTMRAVMAHIARHPPLVGFSAQLHDALARQKQRMEMAYAADADARRQRRANMAAARAGKHPLEAEAESSGSAAKRARMEVLLGNGDGRGSVLFDVSQLALEPVIDAVVAALAAAPDDFLTRACEQGRQAILDDHPDAVQALAPALLKADDREDAVVNPLEMLDDDDEELLLEPLEDELEQQVTIADFRLPPPEPLPEQEKDEVVDYAVRRIWDTGADLSHLADLKISDAPRSAVQPREIWMLLLARLSSRGGEDKRKLIGEFVAKDFASRSKFATVWLNEEWLAKRRGRDNQYDAGLMAILNAYIPTLDAKDTSLTQFLLGLPELPESAIDAIEPLCEDPERMIVGFRSLKELAEARPPLRPRAVQTLLQFCTHPERKVRVMAITTVRSWVPHFPMADAVVAYALGVLKRLATAKVREPPKPEPEAEEAGGEGADGEKKPDVGEGEAAGAEAKDEKPDVEMADGAASEPGPEPAAEPEAEAAPEDPDAVPSKYLGEVDQDSVSQYVELPFALSRRDQDLLDDIFALYPKLAPSVQKSVETMLIPLIRSLGPTKKLLDILRHFPAGAERLAFRVVTVLSAEGSGQLLAPVVRQLMGERQVDPRFVIPIINVLDKGEIEVQIPRIVALLDAPEAEDEVRGAFAAALQKMTPADLLVVLHNERAGLNATKAAIRICFTMTTVFRSDVLANAMQRIVDQPQDTPLPKVFIRTIIQALKPYKSLVPFVANNIIPKLIGRKIWENPELWEGFSLLIRMLGQASFGALLQMPIEQIRQIIEKQPALKAPLKTFLANKPAARNSLAAIFEEKK